METDSGAGSQSMRKERIQWMLVELCAMHGLYDRVLSKKTDIHIHNKCLSSNTKVESLKGQMFAFCEFGLSC